MLDTLRKIIQEAGAAADREEALAIVVRWVKTFMRVDACSVYCLDPTDDHFVLRATDGLHAEAVGKVRLSAGEGVVGLVAERRGPVKLGNASEHPRFLSFPITGEERYRAFLGVPIIHYRRLLGILAVQHKGDRAFDDNDVAFLVTVTAQLAGVISEAGRECRIQRSTYTSKSGDVFYQGTAGSPGIAIGTMVVPSAFSDLGAVHDRRAQDVDAEENAFRSAVTKVQEELRASAERMVDLLPSEAHAVFNAYSMLLADGSLTDKTIERIRAGSWAPAALRDTIQQYVAVFEQVEDPYLQARSEDVRAIGRRILGYLQSDTREPREYPPNCVLVGDEVSLARIAEVPTGKLAGIVCARSSALSHTVVVGRALGVPVVVGLAELPLREAQDCPVIVDGYRGRVFVNSTEAVREEFERLAQEEKQLSAELDALSDQPVKTPDGISVVLQANAGLLSDIEPSLRIRAEGIGLYRTEFPFMLRESFPNEEEQCSNYREVLQAFAPRTVTMRTLDIGGDKPLAYFPIEEDNSFLGWRGIRVTLDHPEIFLTQLRAMLRANLGLNNLRLLLPMISSVREVEESRLLLEQACRELNEEGIDAVKPPLGIMVEVPASVYKIKELASVVDFVSVGTNDLTQYLLAVDRNNARVADRCDSLDTALLQALAAVVDEVHASGKPVSICGEMAGDPAAAVLLLGMGFDVLSMAASSIPRIKWVIRSVTQARARQLLDEALKKRDPSEVRALLNNALDKAGLGGLIRAGK